MKKLILSGSFAVVTSLMVAQLPVSTTPQNKKVILEEFTGIHCTYCPDGHKIANQIKTSDPNNVILLNIHTGSYANPSSGEPDFRTSFGTGIAGQSGLTGYPAGTVNRHLFTGMSQGSGTAMSRGNWSSAANTIKSQSSYVNVALQGTLDVQTRQLTVNVEVYYTGSSGQSTNYLNVALLQNNVEGPQTGAAAFYPQMILPNGKYNHNHMLRHLLTGQWGDVITTTTSGTLIQKQYTYTIPSQLPLSVSGGAIKTDVNLGDLEIVAFVTETQQEVVSGAEGPITFTNFANTNDVINKSVNSYTEICAPSLDPEIIVENNGSATITSMAISYDVNGGTPSVYNWTGSIPSLTKKTITLPTITFTPIASNTLNVNITSVNGTTDGNPADNTSSLSNIIITNNKGTGQLTVNITQDRYGSETTWKIFDDQGTQVAFGGPYSDLSANGTQLNTKKVNLPNTGCYEFFIYDSYGDGINAGYGAGNFNIKDYNGATVLSGNGVFGSSDRDPFDQLSLTPNSVFEISNSEEGITSIYPNPTNENTTLNFQLNQKTKVQIIVRDLMGKDVILDNISANNGNNQYIVNTTELKSGIYMVNVIANGKSFTSKLVVTK